MDVMGIFVRENEVDDIGSRPEFHKALGRRLEQRYPVRQRAVETVEIIGTGMKHDGTAIRLDTEVAGNVIMDLVSQGKDTFCERFVAFGIIDGEMSGSDRAPLPVGIVTGIRRPRPK